MDPEPADFRVGLVWRSGACCTSWIVCRNPQPGPRRPPAQKVIKRVARQADVGQSVVVKFPNSTNVIAQAPPCIDTLCQANAALCDVADQSRNAARSAPNVLLHEPSTFVVSLPRKFIRQRTRLWIGEIVNGHSPVGARARRVGELKGAAASLRSLVDVLGDHSLTPR
jgi:hypothetical protein